MEGDVAWAGAGVIVGEGMRIGEFTSVGVDLEDGDVIGAEIADEKKAVVGRDGGAVRMGGVLTSRVGAECTELLVIFEVDAVDGLAEGAVGLDAIGGDGAAVVVGDEGGVAGVVDGDVGGACSAGGDLARLSEGAGLGVDGEGGCSCGWVVDGVDGVQGALGWPTGVTARKDGRAVAAARTGGVSCPLVVSKCD